MKNERLSRDAWIAAGFQCLALDGPTAIQINLLAAKLGATKGSFYWHFKDLKDFKSAMLSLWTSRAASDVIDEIQRADTAEAQLDILLSNAARAAPDDYGGRNIEPAMRAWSLSDHDVADALAKLDARRMATISKILDGLGINSSPLSALIYAAYIGLDDLHAKGRADVGSGLDCLKQMILAARAP